MLLKVEGSHKSVHPHNRSHTVAGRGVEAVKAEYQHNYSGRLLKLRIRRMLRFFRNGARGVFFATNCYTSNSPVEIEIDCEKARIRLYQGKLLSNRTVMSVV